MLSPLARNLAALLVACCAYAEEIRGLVVDPAGTPLEGATVTLATAAQSTLASATTARDGQFALPVPHAGTFLLTARHPGFAETRLAVQAGPPLRVSLSFQPIATTIVVSAEASRALDADRTPTAATLIPREKLANQSLLSAVVEGETGVHQLRTSPTLGAVFVRGLTGKNAVVFRDGVRYTTSAQRGGISTFLNLVPPEALENVEVLRGPSSAQHGSDALGGTVSLLSRLPDLNQGTRVETGAHYDSPMNAFGSLLSTAHSGARGGFLASLMALRSNTWRTGQGLDSHAAVTRFLGLPSNVLGPRLPDTAFTAYGGTFHGQLRSGKLAQWIAHYERSQQDGGKRYDQLLGGDGNWIADLRNLMLDFGYLRYQRFPAGLLDQISVTGSYNAQREERVNQGGQGNPLGTITHQYEKTKALGAQALAGKNRRHTEWLAGADYYFERIVAPSFTANPVTGAVALVRPRVPDGVRYHHYGGFGQGSLRLAANDRFRLAGALRYGGATYHSRAARSPLVNGRPLWPDDSLTARAWSGRLGAIAWARDWIGLHVSYANGYRVPNATDLGTVGLQGNGAFEVAVADLAGLNATIGDRADDQAVSSGSPVARLRPERSHSADGGVRLRFSRWQADLSAFSLHLGNTIISQTLILPAGALGRVLGDQIVTRQLPTGAVFVPASNSPVLVRANFSGARLRGIEQRFSLRLPGQLSFRQNLTYVYAEDARTGLPPDIEPGVPPLTVNPALAWRPRRFWVEAYLTLAGRQDRLSSLALSDRRLGNPRSRASIQSFFNNGARTRGLVANGLLLPTGETLAQVQARVLGPANSAPQFTAIPGFAVAGLRGGLKLGEQTDLQFDLTNLTDKNYRGIGWGIDGAGRGISLRLRHRWSGIPWKQP